MAADVVELELADTAAGIPVRIRVEDGNVYINESQVVITDIEASNGVIHVIDSVILPPADIVDTAVADGRFETLAAALGAANLVETLKGEGPFTVFAPTDDAFAKLPEGTVEASIGRHPRSDRYPAVPCRRWPFICRRCLRTTSTAFSAGIFSDREINGRQSHAQRR